MSSQVAAPHGSPKISDLADFESELETRSTHRAYAPLVIQLRPGQFREFESLCRSRDIGLVDAIEGQLAELARVRHPASREKEVCERFIAQILAAHRGAEHYGNWVHYPWESNVVHLLARDDYFDVITSRNQDKITREEQLLLRTKRIGVVGLSVGAEIAVTVAQEHLCGAILLADFDRLDLSNLNRLNAGVDQLGENKAHLVARRIAKLDPYLEVTVYDEGLSEENAGEFLDGLDLLIEECDGLRMKYRLRELAKERRVNVVYAADERALLSVEPYANVPDLQPFHGRIDAPQSSTSVHALVEWLGGWESLSERSRRSVERIGRDLCGYPQLASEPRLAAGQVGHVARRLLLGEPIEPTFEQFDLASLLRPHEEASTLS